MNKTINIHLAKISFTIEELAYGILKNYLDELNRLFDKTEGKNEIIEDIELRIAELFAEQQIRPTDAITQDDVEAVIAILGRPEELMLDKDDADPQSSKTEKHPKSLFRDPDDRYIGGVAGGLGHYLGVDSVWIRLIMILLIFSSVGGLVYILLWILVPEAKTTADKLKMKGEPINVSTIKNKIKEEIEEVGKNVKDVDYKNAANQLKKKSKELSSFLGKVFNVIFRIIVVIVGVFLIVISSLILLGVTISSLLGTLFSTLLPFEFIQFGLSTELPFFISGIAVIFTMAIPMILLFTLGLRLLSKNKAIMGKTTRLVLVGLWFLSILTLLGVAFFESKSLAITASHTSEKSLVTPTKDTLRIMMNEEDRFENSITIFNQKTLVEDGEGKQYRLGEDVKLDLKTHNHPEVKMSIKKTGKGWTQKKAQQNAHALDYQMDYFNNQLLLNPYWKSLSKSNVIGNKITTTLFLPEGKYVQIDDNVAQYLDRGIDNDQDYYRQKIAGHLWKVENNLLVCQDCSTEDKDGFQLNMSSNRKRLKINVDEKGVNISTDSTED